MFAAYLELVAEARAAARTRHQTEAHRSSRWRRVDAMVDRAAAAIAAAGGADR